MKKTRIKSALSAVVITTRAEAERAVEYLATLTCEKNSRIAARDLEILNVTEKHNPTLTFLEEDAQRHADALKAWAEANPSSFPKDKKSIDFAFGTIGFRMGNFKLALLSRAWNWDKCLQAVRSVLPNFIRNKPEIDKEALIAQRDEPVIEFALKQCGMKVAQDESFFVEPNLTAIENRRTIAAKKLGSK